MTPFEAVVYSSLQSCEQAYRTVIDQKLVPDPERNAQQAPLNQALSGQSYVHVNDLSGVSSNLVGQ